MAQAYASGDSECFRCGGEEEEHGHGETGNFDSHRFVGRQALNVAAASLGMDPLQLGGILRPATYRSGRLVYLTPAGMGKTEEIAKTFGNAGPLCLALARLVDQQSGNADPLEAVRVVALRLWRALEESDAGLGLDAMERRILLSAVLTPLWDQPLTPSEAAAFSLACERAIDEQVEAECRGEEAASED